MKRLWILPAATAALAAAGWSLWWRHLPTTAGTVRLDGLEGPVEILRDRWGVPHIYARSEEDLFFAQGYVHAQDRLWQMELQRRIGAGRLSEIFGEVTLEADRFFRILGLNRAAEADLLAMSQEERRILEVYAAGVNAYIHQRRGRLGLEFTLLRRQPDPWRPVDSLYWTKAMTFNLSGNLFSEMLRARLTMRLGADRAADLEPPYPADNPITAAGSADPNGPTPPNGWGGEALRSALRQVQDLLGGPATSPPPPAVALPTIPLVPGASNQWAVSGQRSVTGRPLLANDTHLALSMPGVFYQVHLEGGRYRVAGVSLPGVPGVIVGHNDHCAWGLTTAWQDAQDLYIERFHPENPRLYQFQGEWREAQAVQEVIHVKGRAAPVIQEVLVTHHGPLVNQLLGIDRPLALRWVALEPTRLLRAVLGYNCAQSWEEFRAALADWAAPAHNFVYADRDGNIAFLQAGWAPVRRSGYGMAPVPGWTGDHEWERYLTLDELPQAFNPPQGWIAVANNLVVGPDYAHFLSSDLENPCRAARVAELLADGALLSADDCRRFQMDDFSSQAKRFVRHLLTIQPTNQREADALERLRAWDFRMDADSVAATLYHVCRLQALHVVFDGHLGDLADAYIGVDILSPAGGVSLYQGRSIVRLLNMLDALRDTAWLADPATGLPRPKQEVVHRALRQALKWLREALGPDMDTWTWGRLNQVVFAHPLGAVKPLHRVFNRGPYPAGGDSDTLLRAIAKPVLPPEPVLAAAAMRFVADLSDWDRCGMVVPAGQSGHVASRHYDDQIEPWRRGELLPMPFSRPAVDRATVERLLLTPARPAAGASSAG
ncbi:MAG: penicillin acylase family protein [Caldilineales bacterium]|nr:penicillin acylase family protein [Caldilineales bacterium]MDW8319521.1 penicillin acylase family protein [Anaerolineae bacterium]